MDQTYDTSQPGTWNAAFITNNGGSTQGAEAALAAALQDGRAYFNVHTALFPSGEIRGFLVPQSTPAIGSIPTLSEWGMIALVGMLALAAFVSLRQRSR